MEKRINQLREIREKLKLGGGQDKIDKVHAKGKLSARERVDMLMDPGSVVEFGTLVGYRYNSPADGLIAGHGTINGRRVCFYCQDPTVQGGSIGMKHGFKMYTTVERAMDMKVPFIGLHDSPGARMPKLDSGAQSAFGGGEGEMGAISDKNGGSIFFPNTHASGYVPQISAILGNCAGISVYSPALNDFIFMTDKSNMYITGPRMVKSVMHEDVTGDDLGGSKIHTQKSGVADLRFPTEEDCFNGIKELLSYLPSNCEEKPPRVETGDDPTRFDDELADIVPSDSTRAFDMRKVIRKIADNGKYFEIKPEFAKEMTVGFGRLDGYSVGFVANNSMTMAGSLTVDSSDKQARFIRFCDCFNIPLVFLIDTSAYLPGSVQEHAGIIRHGAKVLYALCESTVPRVAVTIRKAYGGGNLGMGCLPGLNTDMIFQWPIVEAGVMGPRQAVNLFYAAEIMAADDPDKVREEKLKEYQELAGNPFNMASDNIFTEDIIEPRETRRVLINSLSLLREKKKNIGKPKKHGNIPL
ncbi:MAG: acyl-CoA carboxylase subunit beta [Spirochaetota bacterium]|nr:acyl-CoA carboxylase subunit beta [Spirochaetota bacterium]